MERNNVSLKDIYCLIVLYNKSINDSITFKSLKDIDNLNIIICDNSTKNFDNAKYVKDYNCIYFNMNGNKGLSKAYNIAIDFLKEKSGILCLFDDDTDIPKDYFDVLLNKLKSSDADIFLPIVYDSVGILSPCKMNDLKVERINKIEELNSRNITGINSGMAIDLNVFKEYRYNEKFFLDYIDHDFLRSMKQKNKKIDILETKINQNFSGSTNPSVESSLHRFKIYKKDFKYFYNSNLRSKVFADLSILKRMIYLTMKFKTLKFLIKK